MKENTQPQTAEPEIPVPAQPGPLVTPSPTLYGELAGGLIADLDRFSSSVPGFDDETVQPDFVRNKLRVPPEFVHTAVGALFGNNELLNIKALNPDEAQDDRQYIEAMLPVAQKLLTVYKRLTYTIQVRQARLARTAQQIYGIARELARDREKTPIRAQVDAMARARNARPRRRPKPDEATTPASGKEETDTTSNALTKR